MASKFTPLTTPPTIAEIKKSWCGVHVLMESGHTQEAEALNKLIAAYLQVRHLGGADPYPDFQE